MSTTPDVDKLLAPLDFTVTCQVGHVGGLSWVYGEDEVAAEDPCGNPADFVSDLHQHPKDGVHYWCADHLAQTALQIKATVAVATCTCLGCRKPITDVPDLVFNVKPLAGTVDS